MATYYWVGGSGTWDNTSTTNWAASSGGAGGAGPPNSADNVFFDANSGTAATVTVASTAACNICTFTKSDLNLSLSGNVSFTDTIDFAAGTITLNNNKLTLVRFLSSYTATRTVAFGTGDITLTGNNTTIWNVASATGFAYTGTPTVNCTYSGATGTRTISQGASGAAATEANSVSFNITAGTDTVTFASSSFNGFKSIDFTGFAGTWSNAVITVYGNVKTSTGMTIGAGANPVIFAATSGTQQLTTNGKTWDFPIIVNAPGATVQFRDTFVMGSTRALTLQNGTLDAFNQNVTIGSFALASGTKTLTLGSGTWTVNAGWNSNTNVTGLTVSASTATINMIGASNKTFSGGGQTWPTVNQGGAGNLPINQNNTFANITHPVQPATIRFVVGTTQTVNAFSISGTSGNLITLETNIAGSRATIYKATGSVSLSFVSIKDIAATGGANFNAFTSNGCVNGGNNTGWDFNGALYPTIYTVRKTKRYFLN